MSIRLRWLALAVVLAAALPYLPVIGDYFVQDDFGTVMILTKRPWSTFPRWFTMNWMEQIWGNTPDELRPFVAFSYQLTGKVAPGRPELHHILNIGFHAGNALLVMGIGRVAAGLSPLAAAFAGVLFAVLPSQAESAAWITGRVDSMPAFFYLSTFLAYVMWRTRGAPRWYALSIVLFFVTLFSKQNAITMAASLAAYDVIVLDRARRGTLFSCVKAWLPFIVMTAGYLLLRRLVLGHAVRGGVQSWYALETFLGIVHRHSLRVVAGHIGPFADWEIGAAILIAVLAIVALWIRPLLWRLMLCFCAAWWVIGVAPILVATYESPRHVYLASAAWTFLLALVAETLYSSLRRPWPKLLLTAAAAAMIGVYTVRLHLTLETWHELARISKAAVDRVREEAYTAPEGTLILMSVPTKSWEWGIPFVLQPPYQPDDLTRRVRVVAPWRLYCCGPDQWRDYALNQIRAWLDSPGKAPIIAMHFAPGTATVSRVTDREKPELREVLPVFLQTDTPFALDQALVELIERTRTR
jgi:hypothetical protein